MSYSVVLIDDENIIVEGLRRVVDWESFNCHVADTANDAASGAEAIHRIRPDIVFTDIKMPDQSGLSMLAGLKSEFPAMQVSVLTGYRDFNYAQAALRLGVTRYLVKPSRIRYSDPPYLLPLGCAIDGRRLVLSGIDAGDRRQIQHR